MPRTSYFKMGDWNAVCDYCGISFKASQLRADWKGFMACVRDWEPRHPQDFVRGVADIQSVPWMRPPLQPNFISIPIVGGTATGVAIAGIAIAGIAIAGPGFIFRSAKAGLAIAGAAVAGTS